MDREDPLLSMVLVLFQEVLGGEKFLKGIGDQRRLWTTDQNNIIVNSCESSSFFKLYILHSMYDDLKNKLTQEREVKMTPNTCPKFFILSSKGITEFLYTTNVFSNT